MDWLDRNKIPYSSQYHLVMSKKFELAIRDGAFSECKFRNAHVQCLFIGT